MKKFLLLVCGALLSLLSTVSAVEITSAEMGITINGVQNINPTFPASEWSTVDISNEPSSSILITSVTVQVSGSAKNVKAVGSVYKKGHTPEKWRDIPLINQGNGVWSLSNINADLIDDSMGPDPRVFEFYFEAVGTDDITYYYNNGGQDYKLIFAKSGGVVDTGITSFEMSAKVNGGEDSWQSFKASGESDIDVTGETITSLIINNVKVKTNITMESVKLVATMYKQGKSPSPDEWVEVPLNYDKDNKWRIDGLNRDLIEPGMSSDTRVFEFYVKAKDSDDNDYFYNNGGLDYKVIFKPNGESGKDISFPTNGAATLTLVVDGKNETEYIFSGSGDRNILEQPGQLGSLTIKQFSLEIIRKDENVKVSSGSLQYKVYEEGSSEYAQWNGLEGVLYPWSEQPLRVTARLENIGLNVASGLKTDRNYVLEIKYQVVSGSEYFFLPSKADYNLFRFSISTTGVVELQAAGKKKGKVQRFNLAGQPVGENYRGVVVEDGKLIDRR